MKNRIREENRRLKPLIQSVPRWFTKLCEREWRQQLPLKKFVTGCRRTTSFDSISAVSGLLYRRFHRIFNLKYFCPYQLDTLAAKIVGGEQAEVEPTSGAGMKSACRRSDFDFTHAHDSYTSASGRLPTSTRHQLANVGPSSGQCR